MMACLLLERMLPEVSVGAVSQEVPLVRLSCKATVSLAAESKPCSSFQIKQSHPGHHGHP